MFEAKLLAFTWDKATQKIKALAAEDELIATEEDEKAVIFKTLRYGTAGFLQQLGINRMVLGASGGIDSAVTAALLAHILGPRQVLLVNMPGPTTGGKSGLQLHHRSHWRQRRSYGGATVFAHPQLYVQSGF